MVQNTSPETDPLPDLLPRLGAGEPDAARECLDRYGGLVWSLARRHTRTSAEAEDAVQEIFVTVWQNAARFDPAKASEKTFIAMIARRRLIDLHRRKERRPRTVDAEVTLATMSDFRSQVAESRAEASLASRALAALKPEEREAVLMSVYHGMSHSEISRHMDMPLGTVKSFIRRGLIQVRKALGSPAPRLEGSKP